MSRFFLFFTISLLHVHIALSQTSSIQGSVSASGVPVSYATIILENSSYAAMADSAGNFMIKNIIAGTYNITVSSAGHHGITKKIKIKEAEEVSINFELHSSSKELDAIVVSGTLKEVRRLESPVAVEVYTAQFFKKNPTANIFEALQNINGVRPQLNCNVCNTGDIHINGLEGPYTMVLIDGMPIVSSLSTVYGLAGIPSSLVDRIEIVKGPASTLYGSEAVGGLINIITKKPGNAPLFSADVFTTTWKEWNADIGFKINAGKKATALTGINYFKYSNIKDENKDHFTDVTLQDRISLFQKWNFDRKDSRLMSVAARYFYEDRWGGDTRWNKNFRGGDEIYGESIYTKRWELLGSYQLPLKEKLLLSFSYNNHDQDSRYGTTSYIANQKIAFSQLTWDKSFKYHDLLAGAAIRYTYYDDNTPATMDVTKGINYPDKILLPGIFLQDEITVAAGHTILLGFRYDYNSKHGNIYTPRFAYKWNINPNNSLRINAGTGYRVVNLFTEDHAALTGARTIEVQDDLQPEKSYNVNLNYLKKLYTRSGHSIGLDVSTWYTYFNNRIIPDYETHPDKIFYNNLDGHAISKGVTFNFDMAMQNGLKILAGATLQDVSTIKDGNKEHQLLTEKYMTTWAVSYKFKKQNLSVDYTGNLYGPMQLPLLGEWDPRKSTSPAWSIQNLQLTYSKFKNIEIYGGVKNLLNFTPNRGNPFLIARSDDPFDKNVEYDLNGGVKRTQSNPYALTFDPTYVYAPNQGRRGFIGARIVIK